MNTTTRLSPPSAAVIVAALFGGGMSGILFAYALAHAQSLLAFFTIYLTGLPLFLVGLSSGGMAGILASICGAAGLFYTMPANIGVIYTMIFALPSALLIIFALRFRIGDDQKVYWYPEGNLLTVMTVYPCIAFLLLAAAAMPKGGLLEMTIKSFNEVANQLSSQLPADSLGMLHDAIPEIAKILPALLGWTWMFVTVIGLVCAQVILQKRNWNMREPFALMNIHPPHWLVYALAATGLVGGFAPEPFDYIGKNAAIILSLPLLFVGLAVVHAWAARLRHGALALTVFYIVISVAFWFVPLVALLGAVDQWFHFRERWNAKQSSV